MWLLNPPHVRYIAKEAELASELWRHNISIIAAVIIQHWGLRCGGEGFEKRDHLNMWKGGTVFILSGAGKCKIMGLQTLKAEKKGGQQMGEE